RRGMVIGYFAVFGALGGLSLISTMGGESEATNTKIEAVEAPSLDYESGPKIKPVTTEAPTTTLATTTTTTEPVPVVFEAGPGESLGVLRIPALCEEIEVFGYNEIENLNNIIGTGAAVVDKLEVDIVPDENCDLLDQREALAEADGTEVITRSERTRTRLITSENPNGNVDYWEPVAGHEQGLDGGYTSVFPGQPGNVLFAGHGSTFSAAFADIGLLEPGDQVTFDRADGRTFTYEVIISEVLPNNDYSPFLHYSHPDYDSTMTIYRCGDVNGASGSDVARYAVRLGIPIR
ncbi:MAG: sortase, partial [bacterium]|nr:sortase [bacterium]